MNNEMKQDYEEAMERLRGSIAADTVAEYVEGLEEKVYEITLQLEGSRSARRRLEARIKKLESSDGE